MANITDLNADNFDGFLDKGDCVVDFYADWCGPCKVMAPEFEKASNDPDMKDINFGKLNVDGSQDVAGKYGVMSIPTTIFFKKGDQADRFSGAMSADEIKKKAQIAFG